MERVPPNRRRDKIPKERRKRVVRACNACNIRRTKCTGESPCKSCQTSGRECLYPSPSEEKVTISRATYQTLQENEKFLQQCLTAAIPSSQERMDLMGWVRENRKAEPANTCQPVDAASTFSSFDLDSVIDGGRFLADPDGERRFIGIASGAAFLDQLRQFAITVLPLVSGGDGSSGTPQVEDSFTKLVGRYQTHDSRPISLPHVNRFYLPPFEEAEQLLSSLSSFGASREVTTLYWGCLSEVLRQAYTTDMRKSVFPGSLILATLNAALAVATQQMATASSESAQRYYARASLLLGRPLESATRQHIPCLCLMGYYLMGENRRDGAYAYIRTAGHIAVTYGFHQSWMTRESDKRLFWTVYVLDRFLSCLLGRPPMISDDDISVSLPAEAPGLPSPDGLKCHVLLSRIMGQAVSRIYGYGGKGSHIPGLTQICHFLSKLDEWRAELPPSLDMAHSSASDANRNLLSVYMYYYHARIIVTRQLLFSAVRQRVAQCFLPDSSNMKQLNDLLINVCSEAADRNAQLLCQLLDVLRARSLALGMCDYHHAFNASIILELNRLLHYDKSSAFQNTLQIKFLSNMLQSAGQRGDGFTQDCFLVLEDFHQLVERLCQSMSRRNQMIRAASPNQQISSAADTAFERFVGQAGLDMGPLPEELNLATGFEGMLDEFMGWLDGEAF